jgi:hypothetical protein
MHVPSGARATRGRRFRGPCHRRCASMRRVSLCRVSANKATLFGQGPSDRYVAGPAGGFIPKPWKRRTARACGREAGSWASSASGPRRSPRIIRAAVLLVQGRRVPSGDKKSQIRKVVTVRAWRWAPKARSGSVWKRAKSEKVICPRTPIPPESRTLCDGDFSTASRLLAPQAANRKKALPEHGAEVALARALWGWAEARGSPPSSHTRLSQSVSRRGIRAILAGRR